MLIFRPAAITFNEVNARRHRDRASGIGATGDATTVRCKLIIVTSGEGGKAALQSA